MRTTCRRSALRRPTKSKIVNVDGGQVVAILVLGMASVVFVWISFQSLLQAWVLYSPARVGQARAFQDRAAAIHGTVKVHAPARYPDVGPCLWARVRSQEHSGSRNSSWRTVAEKIEFADFVLTDGVSEVHVGEPTEVQGSRSRTTYEGPAGFWGGRSRLLIEWLPIPEELVVVGKLEVNGSMPAVVAHPRLGLLLSPHTPSWAAAKETIKGVLGILAALACAAFAAAIVL